MSEPQPEIKVGQTWRRKRDGTDVVIVSPHAGTGLHPAVRYRIGRKLWDADRPVFLEFFELIVESDKR